MDIATIIGLISAFSLVLLGIFSGGSLLIFWDAASMMIVVGGTIGTTLINYPLRDVFGVVMVVKNVFLYKLEPPRELITQMIELSGKMRKNGVLSIEPMIKQVRSAFFAKGLQMLVDGTEAKDIRSVLEKEMEYLAERHRLGSEIFTTLATFAPALGMIGTLIGLVQMLQRLDDPSKIGPAMAVALITTFYGACIANLLCLPIAGKLKTRSKQEMLVKEMILEAVLSMSAGENPRTLEQKLQAFLSPKEQKASQKK
ncbi:motility protein A [Candidatus Manganitrophus noduliformans]|uniref:Motility protein A n=1 Tax=Candidatus Manganitrophus noduliformans TaxID=2606439 RepID=A0A7X6ID00_9BACT|nr:MotA/TolQ/ExbB proton channel family protein [Candidatus Manganitrophus noduliformans]NKE73060.1 motility protein A [Candidatus Manganitrophus noduliformans]